MTTPLSILHLKERIWNICHKETIHIFSGLCTASISYVSYNHSSLTTLALRPFVKGLPGKLSRHCHFTSTIKLFIHQPLILKGHLIYNHANFDKIVNVQMDSQLHFSIIVISFIKMVKVYTIKQWSYMQLQGVSCAEIKIKLFFWDISTLILALSGNERIFHNEVLILTTNVFCPQRT